MRLVVEEFSRVVRIEKGRSHRLFAVGGEIQAAQREQQRDIGKTQPPTQERCDRLASRRILPRRFEVIEDERGATGLEIGEDSAGEVGVADVES